MKRVTIVEGDTVKCRITPSPVNPGKLSFQFQRKLPAIVGRELQPIHSLFD
jgi:hypothetical protein